MRFMVQSPIFLQRSLTVIHSNASVQSPQYLGHPTKGNMMAIEYNTFLAERIVKGIGIAAVVLLSVVVIAVVAGALKDSGSSSGGNCHGPTPNCHGGGLGGGVYIVPDIQLRRRRRRHRRFRRAVAVGQYMYTPTVHHTYVFQGHSRPVTPDVQSAYEFKSRDEFFEMFFQNVANFMWNAGLVRVPDEAVLAASRKNATPLGLGETHETPVGMLGVKMFCLSVPDEAHMPGVSASTLRVDVVSDARVVVRLKCGNPPSRFTSKTALGKDLGNHSFAVAVGPTTKPPIQPGVWFAAVYAPSGANIKVGGLIFDDTDKQHRNLKLLGNVASSRTVVDDGGDEWEFVEDAYDVPTGGGDGGGAAAAASGGGPADGPIGRSDSEFAAAFALESEHVVETLTQATDLLTLDMQVLADQIGLRAGAPPPPGLAKMDLAAMLFPLLPPPPAVAPPPHAATSPTYDDSDFLDDDEVLGVGEHPDAFTCPITLELMDDPVYTADGHTYDRTSITEWLKTNAISPMTGLDLPHKNVFPNVALQAVIIQYKAQGWGKGGSTGAVAVAAASAGAASGPTPGSPHPAVSVQPGRFDPMTGKPV